MKPYGSENGEKLTKSWEAGNVSFKEQHLNLDLKDGWEVARSMVSG